jgi:hypothetical protein
VLVAVGAVDTEIDVVVTLRVWTWSVYCLADSGFGIGKNAYCVVVVVEVVERT